MSLPTQIAAYIDCFDHFQRAIDAGHGTRVCFRTEGEAGYFFMRMQQARALQRAESRRLHDRDDPSYNKSEFDTMKVSKPKKDVEGQWWVYIRRHGQEVVTVEELEAGE